MSSDSDDVSAVGLRLLWELDAFFAEVGAGHLDAMSPGDRLRLRDALAAASKVLAEVHPRQRSRNGPK